MHYCTINNNCYVPLITPQFHTCLPCGNQYCYIYFVCLNQDRSQLKHNPDSSQLQHLNVHWSHSKILEIESIWAVIWRWNPPRANIPYEVQSVSDNPRPPPHWTRRMRRELPSFPDSSNRFSSRILCPPFACSCLSAHYPWELAAGALERMTSFPWLKLLWFYYAYPLDCNSILTAFVLGKRFSWRISCVWWLMRRDGIAGMEAIG